MSIRNVFAAAAAALAVGAPCMSVHAQSVTVNYYTVGETDRDANHLAGGVFNNEVQNQLGPHGLPVLNTTAYGCVTNCYAIAGAPTDVLANGEITYWSPTLNNGGAGGTSDVVFTGSATVSLPFNIPFGFFPPNGTGSSDSNGFQAATLNANLSLATASTISFAIGADDMAFAFLDGIKVCDLGGVHASSSGTCVTPFTVAAGSHALQVFFVDMNNVESGLYFNVTTQGVVVTPPTSPVPEPSTIALMLAGLGGIGTMAKRRKAARRS